MDPQSITVYASPEARENVWINTYDAYVRLERSVTQVLSAAAGDLVRITAQLNAIDHFEPVFNLVRHYPASTLC